MSRELKQVESALAHDLNNALQVIMGNLELLKRRREFVPEIVEAAIAATRAAAQLADRLVALGRLSPYEPRAIDLNHLLQELCEMLERTAGANVRVELELARQLAAVQADPRALQLALVELATNAGEAMPRGGKLTLRTAAAPGGLVMLEVKDTGTGIAPATLARVFEPLVGAAATKPPGLGLHIVERCIRQAGGRVELDSKEGVGTTVRLYLPPK